MRQGMNNVKLEFKNIRGHCYRVFLESRDIGMISFYKNKFHTSTRHFCMDLSTYDVGFAQEFGENMAALAHKSLQIMVESDQKEKICFLEAAGFQCKRKCYEIEVAETNLVNQIRPDLPIRQCYAGEPLYLACVKLLYHYYQDTHNEISPLTATFQEFSEVVPKMAYYIQEAGAIQQAIFVEDDELAYCCCLDEKKFGNFAAEVLGEMYSHYSNIFFEADDCDRAAMSLLGLFQINLPNSHNTYIREGTEIQ